MSATKRNFHNTYIKTIILNVDCSLVEFIYHLVLQYWSRTSENIVIGSVLTALSNGDSFVKLSRRYPMTAEF